MQEQAELIGLPARARRLVGAREALHVLDQVLGVATGTEHLLVERLAATLEARHDEADVGAECGRLDAGDELARPAPFARLIAEPVEAAHGRLELRAAPIALLAPRRAISSSLELIAKPMM